MPSTYSTDLRIELIATGEQSGTWGTTTNNNLGTLIEDAIAGRAAFTTGISPYTLTANNGAADQARCAALELNTSTGANYVVIVPTVTKLYVVKNVNADYSVEVKTAAGAGVVVPATKTALLRCDGTNIVEQLDYVAGNFSVGGNTAVDGNVTVGGDVTVTGDATVTGDLSVGNNITVPGTATLSGSAFLGGSQTATINVATPAVITVSAAPVSGTAVAFSTTGVLPTGLTVGTVYYVSKINATTFNVSASPTLSPLVATSATGSGTHTATNISLAVTPSPLSNSTQVATTAFVTQLVDQLIDTTNWAISETTATQTATISIANPAVVSVATAPANGTAVSFSTTGALPTGITANQAYYVANRASTTYNLATTVDVAQEVLGFTIASPGVVTVAGAPQNGDQVSFTTTDTLPTGITAGVIYYVISRTSTTFQIAATPGGTAINFTGSYAGTAIATSRTLIITSGSQSGTQTETTSKLFFKYKSINRLSLDLGGNLIASGNVTAYGTV